MSFWHHIAGYFKRETKSDAPAGASPRTGGTPLWTSNNTSALSVAAVYCCVKLISESVACLPLLYMTRRGGIFVPDNKSRLDYLLNVQPDYTVSAFDHWRQVVTNILLDGNAYIVPVYNPASMDMDRLALCGRGAVIHDTLNDTYTVCDVTNGIFGTYDESEIIHLKGMTVGDPKKGVSVLEYARRTAQIASTGDRETLNRFANGGNVHGIVSNGTTTQGFGEYQDKQLEAVASDMDARLHDGNRIVSIPGQVDFKQISLSSTDMQFLESRKFTVLDICRFFRVPPPFVFSDTSSNYKSAEQASLAFLNHTLNPMLRSIESEMQRKLVAPELHDRYKLQFDRRALYACDLDSRVKYQAQTIAAGLCTVNEWRQEENKPPVEGGDTVLVSANLRGITEIVAQPQSAAEPVKEPKKEGDDE